MHLAFILHKFNEFSFIMRILTTIVIFTTQHLDDAFVLHREYIALRNLNISYNLEYPYA